MTDDVAANAGAHPADTAALGIDAYVAGVLDSVDDAAVLAERTRRVAAEQRVWVAVASFAVARAALD